MSRRSLGAPRRPTASAAALYALLALALVAPGLAPGRTLSASDYLWTATPWDAGRPPDIAILGSNREQTDAVNEFQPTVQAVAAGLPDVPLWNAHIMGGRPFLGDPQAQVLSPFSLPAYVLPFWDSLAVSAALKLFVAALGTFLLGRALGMRFAGALLAGTVFGFSLWCVTWVSWTLGSVFVLLPWVALLAELLVRRPGPLPFAGLAAVVGLQLLGGHPSSSFQGLVVVGLVWGARILATRPFDARAAAVRLLWLGSAVAVGAALAAAMLVPFVELLTRSSDLAGDNRESIHRPARYLLGIVVPDFWGRADRGTSLEFASSLEEQAYYVGALPLLLAAAALVLRRDRRRIAAAGVGLAALAVATGLPPLYTVVERLPGFAVANNGRLAVVAVLCAALLAGWGLDDLAGRAPPAKARRVLLAIGVALLVVPVLVVAARRAGDLRPVGQALRVAWGFAEPPAGLAGSDRPAYEAIVRLASLLGWLGLAAAALGLVAGRLRGRLGAGTFAALAVALVVLDLFKVGLGYNPGIPEAHARQPATGAIRFLQAQRPARFAGLDPTAPIALADPLPADVAMRYGLYDARGYALPLERRFVELWRRAVAPDPGCNYAFCAMSASARPQALRVLGLLGVRHLLQHRGDAPLPGLRTAYDGPDARVYANPHALPRAFLVGRQAVVDGEDDALALVGSGRLPARDVVATERELPGLPTAAAGRPGPAGAAGDARIERYEAERVVVRARAARRSLLVLSDTWYPGWKATVDGRPAPIHRVDYLLRGVPTPAGEHVVEFRYEPGSVRAGWVVTLVALAAVLAAAALGLLARRRAARRQSRSSPTAASTTSDSSAEWRKRRLP